MAEGNWYYAVGGQQLGPVSFDELRDKARAGEVRGDDLVWAEGMPEWAPASSVEALGALAPGAGAAAGGGGAEQYDLADPGAAAAAPAHAPTYAPQPGYSHNAPQAGYSPYAPPGAAGGVLGYGTYAYQNQVAYGGFWLRFCAYIIDAIITGIPSFIIGMVVEFAAASANTNPTGQPTGAQVAISLLANVASIVIAWLYWSMFESSAYQATPGKMLLGLRVTDMNGQRISFGRATGRHFAKFISSLICAIGYIMAGFTERKQGLHDQIAGTLVVMKQG